LEGDDRSKDSDDEYRLFQISQGKAKPFTIILVKVNGEDCPIEATPQLKPPKSVTGVELSRLKND